MLLYEDDELLAIGHSVENSSHDFLLITFAYAGMRSDGTHFWGLPLARRLGMNAVGFVAKKLNWYPASSVLAAVDALQPLLSSYKRKIT